jgi:hypothetical protein
VADDDDKIYISDERMTILLEQLEESFGSSSAVRKSGGTVILKTPGTEGPRGPAGATGNTGPQGPPGNPGTGSYHHIQGVPSAVWEVTHNLGFRPGGIHIVDSGGASHIGRVEHINANSLTISFFTGGVLTGFSGNAYLS